MDQRKKTRASGEDIQGIEEKPASHEPKVLRRGWTTGACATAATKSALSALLDGVFLDPVRIDLPGGQRPDFTLTRHETGPGWALASITKDAGDDPDVTHGAQIEARVERCADPGLYFVAGDGVGTVTKAGLPIPVGQAAITPAPRAMIRGVVEGRLDLKNEGLKLTLSIPGGAEIAKKTWNERLGIVGGLSILGTTGVVVPYSCAAWIHSIYRGIDVARAAGLSHVAAATGHLSERGVQALYDLPPHALLDMGDFAGALMKYLKSHPVPRLSIAGGVGKLAKLAQGHGDLHSSRSQVDIAFLRRISGQTLDGADSAAQAIQMAARPQDLITVIANTAKAQAAARLGPDIRIDIQIFDRRGMHLGGTDA